MRYLHPVGELEEQAREEAPRLFQFANVKKAPEALQALLEVERLPGGGGQCLSISQHLGTAGAWGEVHKGVGVGGVGSGSGAPLGAHGSLGAPKSSSRELCLPPWWQPACGPDPWALGSRDSCSGL